MSTHIITVLVGAALAVSIAPAPAQSGTEQGERILRDQEKAWNISCKAVHPKAHALVNEYVAPLAHTSLVGPLEKRFADALSELKELADQTLKCYGLEPIALHSGIAYESDFGELHEALRHAHELITSSMSGEPEVTKSVRLNELQKRMHELKTGTGRRYPARK